MFQQGNVELRNIRLRPEAFNASDAPFEVVAGTAGYMKLKLPWQNLGKQPVIIEMDRVYLLAREEPLDGKKHSGKDDEAQLYAKRSELESQEAAWLSSRGDKDDEATSSGGGGMFAGLIDTIIGNIQLYISNVHVRLEGETFTSGVILHRLSATTVDAHGNETFSVGGLANRLRKIARLQRLAVYMDHGKHELIPRGSNHDASGWSSLKQERWDELFLPGLAHDNDVPHRQYLLYPIDGKGHYERRGKKESHRDMEAVQHASISLDRFMLALSKQQYVDLQGTSNRLSIKMARKKLPYGEKRPHVPVKDHPAQWWEYAVEAIKQTRSKVYFSEVAEANRTRKLYIDLFVKKIEDSTALDEDELTKLTSAEQKYDTAVLLLWRKMAHLRVEQNKAEQAPRRRLFGLLPPRKQSTTLPAAHATQDFSSEDLDKLKEVFQVEEAAPTKHQKDPYGVLSFLEVKMGFGAFYLTEDRHTVAQASLSNLALGTKLYPSTSYFTVSVDSYIVKSANESLIRDGRQLAESSATRALSISFTNRPQDGHADNRLNATAAPCLVTARPEVLENLQSFFKVPKDVDTSAIAAAASEAADRARSAAAASFQQRISDHPSLQLSLQIQAPKLALCTTTNVALLDLGSFDLWSSSKNTYKMQGTGISVSLCEEDMWSWSGYMAESLPVRRVLTPVEIDAELTEQSHSNARGTSLSSALYLRGCEAHVSPMAIASLESIANQFSSVGGKEPDMDSASGTPWSNPEFEHSGSCLFWAALGTRGQWRSTYIATNGGKLYVTGSKTAKKPLREVDLHRLKIAARLHDEYAEDMSNVVVLSNSTSSLQEAMKSQRSTILRFHDSATAAQFVMLVRSLTTSERGAAEPSADEEAGAANLADIEASSLNLHLSVSDFSVTMSKSPSGTELARHAEVAEQEEALLKTRLLGVTLDAAARKSDSNATLKLQSFYVEDCLATKEIGEQAFLLTSRPSHKTEGAYLLSADFNMISPESEAHRGIDTQIRLRLNELTLAPMPQTTRMLMDFIDDLQSAIKSEQREMEEGLSDDASMAHQPPELAKVQKFSKRDNDQILLQLQVNVAALRLVAWEDASTVFAEFAAERLDARVATYPDFMKLRCSLGDILLRDDTLDQMHPHRSFLQVLDMSPNTVLAWTEVIKYSDPQLYGIYYDLSVSGRLSRTKITFRNKFVQELLAYATMLTDSQSSTLGKEQSDHSQKAAKQQQKKQQTRKQQQAVMLDVDFDAPYIVVPRSTESDEALELDLGHLALKSAIHDSPEKGCKVEVLDVSMTDLALWERKAHERNQLNLMDYKISTQIQRPLELVKGTPKVAIDIRVPELKLQLTNKQFELVKSCASENIGEAPRLDASKADRSAESKTSKGDGDTSKDLLRRMDTDAPELWLNAEIETAQLCLAQDIGDSKRSLATLGLEGLGATVRINNDGDLAIRAALPKLVLRDSREGTNTHGEEALKGGTRSGALRQNFISLGYLTKAAGLSPDGSHTPNISEIDAKVHEPSVSLETDFVLSVARFFIPELQMGGDSAGAEILPKDVHLHDSTEISSTVHDSLQLGPRCRLIGDSTKARNVELDGKGGTLILPSTVYQPVILLAPGQHLRFKNITIKGAEQLASAVRLQPGASYSIDPADGVDLLNTNQQDGGHILSNAASRKRREQPKHKEHENSSRTWMIINIDIPGAELIATRIIDESDVVQREHLGILSSLQARIEKVPSGAQTIDASVKGLRMDQYKSQQDKQRDILTLLEPCNVDCRLAQNAGGEREIDASLGRLHAQLSVSTIQFLQNVASDAVVPFVARTAISTTTRFSKVWSGDAAIGERGEEDPVSFWAPIAPPGYAHLGTTASRGAHPPANSVLVIRDISALCSPPVSFSKVWADRSGSVTVWWPQAPNGYVALGCVATREQSEPSKSTVRCVRREIAKLTNDGENMGKTGLVLCHNGLLSLVPQGNELLDLRKPSGVSMDSQVGADDERSHALEEEENKPSKELESATVCDFTNLWTSINSGSSQDVSIWRPVPPNGYYSLGDIAVPGFQGPWQALVFTDNNSGALVRPEGFQRVWKDSGSRSSNPLKRLSLWEPRPPAGYVAVGHVCNVGSHEAPRQRTVMCVREDLVASVKPSIDRSRIWSARGAQTKLGDDSLELFAADPLANTFVSIAKRSGISISLLRGSSSGARPPTTGSRINVKCPDASLLLYDDKSSKRPVPVALAKLSSLSCESAQLNSSSKSKIHATLGASIFNSSSAAYEPLIEGCIISIGQQTTSHESSSLQPIGSRLSVVLQRSNEKHMRITLSKSGVNEVINKYVDNMKLLRSRGEDGEQLARSRQTAHDQIAIHAGEQRIPLKKYGRQTAYVGGATFENRTGMGIALLGRAVRMQEAYLEPWTSLELDPPESISSNIDQEYSLANGKSSRENALDQYVAVNLHALYGLPQASTTTRVRFHVRIGSHSFGRTDAKRANDDGSVYIGEQLLLKIVPQREDELHVIAIDEVTAFYGTRIAEASLSKDWSSIPSDSQEFELHGEEGMRIECDVRSMSKEYAGVKQLEQSEASSSSSLSLQNERYLLMRTEYAGEYVPLPKALSRSVSTTFAFNLPGGMSNGQTPMVMERTGDLIVSRIPLIVSNTTPHAFWVGLRGSSSVYKRNVIEKELFENERYQPSRGCVCRGWGSSQPGHLLPTDRSRYSTRHGDGASQTWKEINPPEGYEWDDSWQLDLNLPGVDNHGWTYGSDFGQLQWPPAPNCNKPSGLHYVRRRRWRRRAVLRGGATKLGGPEPDTIVGKAKAGYEICMPFYTIDQQHLYEICFKPDDDSVGWSMPSLFPWCTDVSNMREGSDVHTMQTTSKDRDPLQDLRYLSIYSQAESVQFVGQNKGNMLMDWTINIATPLSVHNRLPLKMSVSVHQEGISTQIEASPGSFAILHGIHPGKRIQISLNSIDGHLQHYGDPVDLQPGKHLRLSNASGFVTNVAMDVTTTMRARGEAMPVNLQLYVPFWITNRTPLLLACKRMKQQKKQEHQGQPTVKGGSEEGSESIEEDTTEHVTTQPGSDSVADDEFSIGGGNTAMLDGSLGALLIRVLGSKYAYSPLELSSSDKVTIMHAKMRGGSLAPVSITREPGTHGLEHSVAVNIEPHITITNRTGISLEFCQANTELSRPNSLPSGENAKSIVWEDGEAHEALAFRRQENQGGNWSHAIHLDELGEAYFAAEPQELPATYIVASREQFSPGIFEVVLREVGNKPPFSIENKTARSIRCTVGASEDEWLQIPAHACKALLPKILKQGDGLDVTIAEDAHGDAPQSMYTLEQTSESSSPMSRPELILKDNNVEPVASYTSGNSAVLVLGESYPVEEKEISHQLQQKTPESVLDVRIRGLQVSLVDGMPMEILLLSVDEMALYSASNVADGKSSALVMNLNSIQLDDQMPYSQIPVVISHKASGTPLVDFRYASQGCVGNTTILSRVTLTTTKERVSIALHEPLLWKLLDVIEGLQTNRLQELPQEAVADPQLAVKELVLLEPAVRMGITFRTEDSGRPKKVSQLGRFGLSFANISNVGLRLRPIRLKQLTVSQSALVKKLLQRLNKQIISQAISLLTGVGILDSTSKAFGQASSILEWTAGESDEEQQQQQVSSFQRGLFEGGKSAVGGMFKGVKGIFEKPIKGAEREGARGFFKGFGQGVIGAAANPVAGALKAVSNVTEGVASSMDMGAKLLFGQSSRRAAPLAIKGDGIIRSYDEREAVGQHVLRAAQADTLGFGSGFDFAGLFSSRGAFALDKYEYHEELPKDRIIILTSERMVMLEKPSAKTDLMEQACSVRWEVHWEEMRNVEQREKKAAAERVDADQVTVVFEPVVPRKTLFDTSKTVHSVKCASSSQARALKAKIEELALRFRDEAISG